MTWGTTAKAVFAIEIETCRRFGGKIEVIASIEDADAVASGDAIREIDGLAVDDDELDLVSAACFTVACGAQS